MRDFFSDIFLFIYSTLGYWQALVSGGVVTALIVVFERLSDYRLNRKTFLGLFVGVFLLVAFFLCWREEHLGRLRQEAEINRLLSAKPRLKGSFEFFQMGDDANSPGYMGVAMVMSIANVGSTPTIADHWSCNLSMVRLDGTDVIKGEVRSFPEGLAVPRGSNQPMIFGRDDALYIKTMRTPITPGAKVVGAMFCRFPNASLGNLRSSEDNALVVSFRDVIGEEHQVVLRYMNQPGMDYG